MHSPIPYSIVQEHSNSFPLESPTLTFERKWRSGLKWFQHYRTTSGQIRTQGFAISTCVSFIGESRHWFTFMDSQSYSKILVISKGDFKHSATTSKIITQPFILSAYIICFQRLNWPKRNNKGTIQFRIEMIIVEITNLQMAWAARKNHIHKTLSLANEKWDLH